MSGISSAAATGPSPRPLPFVPEAIVLPHGGTAAGIGVRTGKTTPLSHYYNDRDRLRFIARHTPKALPIAYAASARKAFGMLRRGIGQKGCGVEGGEPDGPK